MKRVALFAALAVALLIVTILISAVLFLVRRAR